LLYEYLFVYLHDICLDMIAKILSSSGSFNGVSYNEHKNDKGQSELLVAKNFDGLDVNATKQDYKDYLKAYAKTNETVKKPQFHATISCKEREYSFEELKDIAEQWVNKMGYGQQPYLIYGHNDTDNNHVHIVSVRVDSNGKKIDHNFEKLRSQRVLNEIMKLDYKEQMEKDYKNYTSYNFSSVQQFKLLFENAGWKVAEKDGKIQFSKGGEQRKAVDKSAIEELIKNNSSVPDEQRTKQIKALLHKYKEGLTHTELKDLMKSKFGIDLIFHTGKGHTTPYGYTVIDHSGRNVYKGSELLNIKELLVTPERENKIKACSTLVETLLNTPKINFEAFKTDLSKLGYKIDTQGKIYLTGEKQALFSLNKDDLKMLRYNSRLHEAGKFNARSRGEALILSKLFFVKASDITVDNKERDINTVLYYRDMMNSYLNNTGDIKQVMADKNITFMQMGKDLYLIDSNNKEIISNNDLNVSFSQSQEQEAVRVLDSDRLNDFDLEKNHKVANGVGLIDALSDFLDQNYNGQEDRKRKKKQDRSQ